MLDALGIEKINEIASKTPEIAKSNYENDDEGELREDVMDSYDTSRFQTDDTRTKEKHDRVQC